MRLGLVQVVFLSLSLLRLAPLALSQQVSPRPLITQPIVEGQLTTLKGNTHPLARAQFDIGAAPLDLSMQRMLLVLKRSPEQEFALRKLVDDQQDKASPNYHKWLTPDEFGVQFGPSDQDLQLVTGWLQTHGFQVNRVTHGRTVVEFSGTEAQVEEALHTQIHKYLVNGQEHWANASDPQIPAALVPAVAGVWSLHDFRKQPKSRISPYRFPVPTGPSPQLTFQGQHALMPADYAIIYNINPVYSAGINGQGAKIAVVARSGINTGDLYNFWSFAGLPTFPGLQIINDGPDPGIFDQGEEFEAVLDSTWSGAIAYGAQVNFVVSASTNTTDGVDLSEIYIIDSNLGDVMTESFGSCEGFSSQAEAHAISSLAEQAAAEGISYMVSSGDSGAETCVNPNRNSAGGAAPSVNVLASSPFTLAVGGTIFNDGTNASQYWNTSNNQVNLSSAKTYIPENVWNESCSTCGLWAGGGGASTFFPKPNWQFGVSGIPSDGFRDLPDVSLTAAIHDPYLLCFEGSCSQGGLYGVGGTSASAPSFAGIMAMIVQQYGRQGQANYVLYRLAAAETFSQCNASNTTTHPASTCVFNDVTKGNNAVPGEPGYGTSTAKYQATTGFDLATGLGSVNVANLVNKWNSVTFNATTTTLGPSSITGTHGSPITLNVSVTPNGAAGTPTGDVSLQTDFNFGSLLSNAGFLSLTSGSVSGQVTNLPGGNYNLAARYEGDTKYAPSVSNQVSVNINPENSTTTGSVLTADVNGNPIPFTSGAFGGFLYPRADVTGVSGNGTATGLISFNDNGVAFATYLSLNSQGYSVLANGYPWFTPGHHSFTASYNGDTSFNPSTSSPVTFTITPATTATTAIVPSNGTVQGNIVTLTANITSAAFAGEPSATFPGGTVTFVSGNTQFGSAQVFGQLVNQHGVTSSASLNISTLPVGQNTITAQYSGDANYVASAAAPATVIVDADFSFSAGSSSVTVVQPGSSATNTLTIAGQTGYNNTINFSRASCTGLPSLSTCGFSPSSVVGSGNSTVTITTTAPSAALHSLGWASAGFVFAGVLLLGAPMRRRSQAALGLILCSVALGSAACGGGGGGGGGGGHPGTPPGSYNVVVIATTSDGVVSHTANFTLLVQ
jgi:subtilase family serine protease